MNEKARIPREIPTGRICHQASLYLAPLRMISPIRVPQFMPGDTLKKPRSVMNPIMPGTAREN